MHVAVPPARNPIYKQKIALKAIFICIYAKIIVSLHPQFHAGDVCASSAGVADILKRRLLTLCSDLLESRKFQEIQDLATIDVLGMCISYTLVPCLCTRVCVHIGVGFALSVLISKAMREPQKVELTKVGLHAFFICIPFNNNN